MNDLSRLSIEELTDEIKSFILFDMTADALTYIDELGRRAQEAEIGKLEAQLQRKTRQARIFYKMYKIQLDAIEFPPTLRETAKRLVLDSAKKQLKEEEKL